MKYSFISCPCKARLNCHTSQFYDLHGSAGLIKCLQRKLAKQGVKISVPGLEGVCEDQLIDADSESGLLRLLSGLCGLELNGNLHSELKQMVQKERGCLLQDPLLNGLLDSHALRHCLDTALENSTPGKLKVLEVQSYVYFTSIICSAQNHTF